MIKIKNIVKTGKQKVLNAVNKIKDKCESNKALKWTLIVGGSLVTGLVISGYGTNKYQQGYDAGNCVGAFDTIKILENDGANVTWYSNLKEYKSNSLLANVHFHDDAGNVKNTIIGIEDIPEGIWNSFNLYNYVE